MDAQGPPPTPSLRDLHREGLEVYMWGRNDLGQLGCEAGETLSVPARLSVLDNRDICAISGSMFHSAFVTGDGDVLMCGSNDAAQLARRHNSPETEKVSIASRAPALETHAIESVAAGSSFTVAVNKQGKLLGWGNGEAGQLGEPTVMEQVHPRMIKGLPDGTKIMCVSAGEMHVLALSAQYQVYSFGLGLHGALGHDDSDNRESPTLIEGLWTAGVVAIAAGGNHSMALSASGRVYTWGMGKHGALGHGTSDSLLYPREVAELRGSQVDGIAAGEAHSVALASTGRVFAWGHNQFGQLGVGTKEDSLYPVPVQTELSWGIMQISAGANHTLFLSRSGAIYGCGSTESGQLGAPMNGPALEPRPVLLHTSTPSIQTAYVLGCGEHSMAVCCESASMLRFRGRFKACSRAIPVPNLLQLAKAAQPDGESPDHQFHLETLKGAIKNVFSSPGLVMAGFALPGDPNEAAVENVSHGLHLPGIQDVFEAMLLTRASSVVIVLRKTLAAMLKRLAEPQRKEGTSAPSVSVLQAQWLKVLVICLLNPINSDASNELTDALSEVLVALQPKPRKILVKWMADLPKDVLGGRAIRPLQSHLTDYIESHGWSDGKTHALRVGVILQLLDEANKLMGYKVTYDHLANTTLSDAVLPAVHAEWALWHYAERKEFLGRQEGAGDVTLPTSLCQLPFLMTPECKKEVIRGEAVVLQRYEVQQSVEHAIACLLQGQIVIGQAMGALHIRVRRDHVMEDAMRQLEANHMSVRKPLKVTFLGGERGELQEEAVDEGGVSKEFFQLLIRELFSPAYGMFIYNEETREYYFNPAAADIDVNPNDFTMVGITLGVAIFNGVILDVKFPLVVYKKLLNGEPNFADLEDAQPTLARNLTRLLEYEGDDIQEVFGFFFEWEYNLFDTAKKVELEPGGSQIPVTKENRHRFVELVQDWYLNKSIENQFQRFREGFYSVLPAASALALLNHYELELLVCGLPHLDFHALQASTRYDAGYNPEHPTIVSFWNIIHGLTLEKQRRFLTFVTGCDRAPMGGLGKLRMIIQRAGPDSDRLPTAHTCFNALILPEYASTEKLNKMILTAIENAEGFGLQ